MRRTRRMLKVVVVVGILVLGLVFSVQSASAGVTWCSVDLGPMATTAEATGNIPQSVLDKVVATPDVAVSTAKDGTNEHK